MFDDSNSCDMVMLNSQPQSWDFCPETTIFRLKIVEEDQNIVKFMYSLKEGVPLPYNPDIPQISKQDKKLVFTKEMKPTINGVEGIEKIEREKSFWYFYGNEMCSTMLE